MKKFVSLILSIIIIFSISTTTLAEREFVGETVVKNLLKGGVLCLVFYRT